MVYVNLQLEIEDPHENHSQVNVASSLNICIIITFCYLTTVLVDDSICKAAIYACQSPQDAILDLRVQ